MSIENSVKGQMMSKIQNEKCYPHDQNERIDNVIWYKEDSYKNGNKNANLVIEKCLSNASKSQKGYAGIPDYIIDTKNFFIVIEAKAEDLKQNHKHSSYLNVSEYCNKGYDSNLLGKVAIDDVLWYAKHLNNEKDVIAIACSGEGSDETFRLTSFYLKKDDDLSNIELIEDGDINNTFMDIKGYEQKIREINGELQKTYEEVYEELRKYAAESASFMYKVGVDDADRLGLVSIIVLALTNTNSDLYKNDILKYTDKNIISKEAIINALLEDRDLSKLGIIISDGLPPEKSATLKEYITKVLSSSNLTKDITNHLTSPDKKVGMIDIKD